MGVRSSDAAKDGREEGQRVVKIDLDLSEFPRPSRRHLTVPCGCVGKDSGLHFGKFPHTSYLLSGEKVEVEAVLGWKCSSCHLTVLAPEVGDAMFSAIKKELGV